MLCILMPMRPSSQKFPIMPVCLLIAILMVILFVVYNTFIIPTAPPGSASVAGELQDEPRSETVARESGPGERREEPETVTTYETVQQGDTAARILQPFLSPAEVQAFADACEGVFSLRKLREGRSYVLTSKEDFLVGFAYEIDADEKLIVEREDGEFNARLEKIHYDVTVTRVTGSITSHLFQAVADSGEDPALAIALADIFAWEINFIRDLRPEDAFRVLVEKRYRDGEFKGYGRILAAEFVNQGVTYEAFCFRDAGGFPHYYTSKGESVKRAFLKAPLSFTRISSTFSPRRLHPILQVWRAHPGIDYAAPKGTPVKAVGGGVVTFKGFGKGAGNYIAIRHNNSYETMYLHLSAFARGLVKGKKVQQGEVIGFVGSTGYSTGPHLDFRMKKDGVYINPLKMVSPRTEPVSKKDLAEFQALIAAMRARINQDV